MSSSIKNKEISLVGSVIEILTINTVSPNAPECYALNAIKSVVPTFQQNIGRNGINTPTTYPFKDRKTITINFMDETSSPSIKFDIEEISNQPTWTPDFAGLLQAQADICGWITSATGAPVGGATEATLLSVLNAIVASNQDVEVLLVRDTGNGNQVLQQITDYVAGTPATYKDVNGNVVVPVGPLEYLDPSAVLSLILSELQTLNTVDFATETTQAANNVLLGTIDADTSSLAAPTTGLAVTYTSATGVGSVIAGKRRVSFFNAGNAAANIAGGTANLDRGESVTFSADGLRDTLAAIAYDATGTILKISTVG